MNPQEQFKRECAEEIAIQGADAELKRATREWMNLANARKYSYHFTWLGRPVIQYPQDIVAMQELIWSVQPDLIVETGIAHGGSLILSASMLELNAVCGGPSDAIVIGIDIDIRAHNRAAIEAHPLFKRIRLIQGSSVAPDVVAEVQRQAAEKQRVLVFLDSNHTHEHVAAELNAYAPLTSVGSYCVVFDTIIEELPPDAFVDRPWSRGNNAMTAVRQFLATRTDFEADQHVDDKLLVSVAPSGYLKRVR
jgi:cephalosporin hydroxylase